jgi:dTDP-glucose 4,6-dehydratase
LEHLAMSRWEGERVVITGAGGFIGSHLTDALVRRGADVCAFLHYRPEGGHGLLDLLDPEVRSDVEVVASDLRDVETVRNGLRGASEVFHLGALVGIPYSYRSPRDVVEVNILGTLNVLEAARLHDVDRVVHTSTSEVYGSAQTVPMSEDHPLNAQSPYAASKIAADQLALSFHRSFGLPVAVARPFNTYGPGQTARAIVPTVISQALVGDTLQLGSLSATRDLNFVTDTAAGFMAIAETPETVGRVLNIGTGHDVSIRAVVELVGDLLGKELRVESDQRRVRPAASEVERLVCDATRLRELTGWAPEVPLPVGLERTIEWIRNHLERFRPQEYAV